MRSQNWTLVQQPEKTHPGTAAILLEQGMVRVTDGTDDVFMDDAGG